MISIKDHQPYLLMQPLSRARHGQPSRMPHAAPAEQTAVFAGGCFWGVDAVFKHVKGVTERRVRICRRRCIHRTL